MARIAPIRPEEASPAVAALYERLRQTLGIEPNNFFKTLAHQPELLAPMIELTGALLEGGGLDRRLKEWVILHVARAHGCPYVFDAHMRALSRLMVGASLDAPAPVGAFGPDEGERLAIRYADEILTSGASAETFAALRGWFSEPEIVELTLLVGFYRMVCHLVTSLETPHDPLRFLAQGPAPRPPLRSIFT